MTELPDVPFNLPSMEGRELDYVQDAARGGHLASGGDFTRRTAELLAAETGAAEVLMTTSCTAALELSAMLLDLQEGDTVIVPSFTFTSTGLAYARQGAGLVFCDIEPVTLGLDPAHLETLLDEHVRAVVIVHYAGIACDVDGIRAVLERVARRPPRRGQRPRPVRHLARPAARQPGPLRHAQLPRDQELRVRRGRCAAAQRPRGRRPRAGALRQGHQPARVHARPGRQVHVEGHRLVVRPLRRARGLPPRPARDARGDPGQAPRRRRALRDHAGAVRRRARLRADAGAAGARRPRTTCSTCSCPTATAATTCSS